MPDYALQTMKLPSFVCDDEEAICWNFISGSSDSQRKWHLVSWGKICQPKEHGGVGFKNLKILNKAYIVKLAWQMINDPEKLWVQIMKAK